MDKIRLSVKDHCDKYLELLNARPLDWQQRESWLKELKEFNEKYEMESVTDEEIGEWLSKLDSENKL